MTNRGISSKSHIFTIELHDCGSLPLTVSEDEQRNPGANEYFSENVKLCTFYQLISKLYNPTFLS